VLVTSAPYIAFLILVFALRWLAVPRRLWTLSVVIAANLWFAVVWAPVYLLLLPLASAADFGLARAMPGSSFSRIWMLLSVAMNTALILSPKWIAPDSDWALPLGLSFYGFQAMTYTIDVYRRDAKPIDSWMVHLASVTFFPTLLAGPITRVAVLAKQWKNGGPANLDGPSGATGLYWIGLGAAKKFLLADYLADHLVNRVFDTPSLYSSAEAIFAVYGYAFQLYCDFSGYTDMALGSALLLGFKLPVNFKNPYSATSMADFWRRWHISLSDWLRDYLYFSLPGLRMQTKIPAYVNLVVTMLIGGLWHGLSMNFAVWGVIHGVSLAAQRFYEHRRRPADAPVWRRVLVSLATFHLVCFAWIFFRAPDLGGAMTLLSRITAMQFGFENLTPEWLMVLAVAVAGHYLPTGWAAHLRGRFVQAPALLQAAALAALVVAVQKVAGSGLAPFIYSSF
jgi:D-alanyl-lipoteichoic acid acyltransferase DltB (MBOAT superfamily)